LPTAQSQMEILTSKAVRRSTRLRVQIPVTMTSLDRRHAFVAECVALVVSPQGAGLQAPQALPIETPVMLSGLPDGASASARVASCLPLGREGSGFLIGISLYNPGNVWGVPNPPDDWKCTVSSATSGNEVAPAASAKNAWPYNLFAGHTEVHPKRK
jgi:hypothetical protein